MSDSALIQELTETRAALEAVLLSQGAAMAKMRSALCVKAHAMVAEQAAALEGRTVSCICGGEKIAEMAAVIERARRFEDIFETDVADALEALCDGKESTAAALMRRAAERIKALPAPKPEQEK